MPAMSKEIWMYTYDHAKQTSATALRAARVSIDFFTASINNATAVKEGMP
jgi:hypothetical protein